jgi:DNA-nicking Smr family endonuclease
MVLVSKRHKPSHSRAVDPPSPDSSVDDDVFARAMSDVVPLPPDRRRRMRSRAPLHSLRPLESSTRPLEQPEAPADSRRDDFTAHGVDRREVRKLRRGTYTVQGRLDLHGQTLAEASVSLDRFIEQSRHTRRRCVCIVHGRGLNSPGGVSVLRDPVRDRLARTPWVLAFSDAPPSDGGSGAVYVLLRR